MVICHAAKTHWVQWVLKMRFFKVGSSQKLIIGCAKEYFKGNGNGNIFCKKKVEHTAVLISWFISQPLLWCAPTYANIFFFLESQLALPSRKCFLSSANYDKVDCISPPIFAPQTKNSSFCNIKYEWHEKDMKSFKLFKPLVFYTRES